MKISLYSNDLHESLRIKNTLKGLLEIDNELTTTDPELVITIGGDGTMLHAIHEYMNIIDNVMFVGVHTGHLGFYTDFTRKEVHDLVIAINEGKYTIDKFPLLKVSLCYGDKCDVYEAANETTIVNSLRTLKAEVYINNNKFEKFYGTGICISTPSGSTGYNKSLGGAILQPTISAFQMTEMAAINNNVYRTVGSPMILDKSQTISLSIQQDRDITVTVDFMHKKYESLDKIMCSLSNRTVKFARFKDISFFNRVKKSFL